MYAGGSMLMGVVEIMELGGQGYPVELDDTLPEFKIEYVWVINPTEEDEDEWDVSEVVHPSDRDIHMHSVTLRSGPMWEPTTRIDVIVSLTFKGVWHSLLRNSNTVIAKTS